MIGLCTEPSVTGMGQAAGVESHEERLGGGSAIERNLQQRPTIAIAPIRKEVVDAPDSTPQSLALELGASPTLSTLHSQTGHQRRWPLDPTTELDSRKNQEYSHEVEYVPP